MMPLTVSSLLSVVPWRSERAHRLRYIANRSSKYTLHLEPVKLLHSYPLVSPLFLLFFFLFLFGSLSLSTTSVPVDLLSSISSSSPTCTFFPLHFSSFDQHRLCLFSSSSTFVFPLLLLPSDLQTPLSVCEYLRSPLLLE